MTLTRSEYREGLTQQAFALRELNTHADRLIAGLPWITDEVAEVVELLQQRATDVARACASG